jgi:hypothetical protein
MLLVGRNRLPLAYLTPLYPIARFSLIGVVMLALGFRDVYASGTTGPQEPSSSADASSDSIPDGYDEQQLLRCKEQATPVGKEGFLGVCDRSDGIEVTDTVIYDSTDQIALRSSLRSPQWKAVARSLDKKAPFDISGIASLEKLSGHYYKVDFQVTLPPDF